MLALADGHGAAPHFRSGTGAHMAVDVATAVLTEALVDAALIAAEDEARAATVVHEIVERWRAEVRADVAKSPLGPAALDPFTPYGTTLIAAAVSPESSIIMAKLGLLDSYQGLILIYWVHSLPVAIWVLRGFFHELPRELEDAASVDGASRLRILWSVIVPLSQPALAAVALLVFLNSWNEFVIASIMTSSALMRTAQVFLYTTMTDVGVNWLLGSMSSVPLQCRAQDSVTGNDSVLVLFFGMGVLNPHWNTM